MKQLTKKINELIPGGAHTYSKGHDQFPENAPALIQKGVGAWVSDENGEMFLDCAMGLTSVSIGHGDEEIARAVYEAALLGTNYSKPAMLELTAAEFFLKNVAPQHDMVKFTKNGSTATTAAIKLARAATGREKVLVPEQFPFFSYDDWFIAGTVSNHGTQLEARKQILKFEYGNIQNLEQILLTQGHEIAALIMEPVKFHLPPEGYLKLVKNLCAKHGVIFVLDEMWCGAKLALGGGQEYFNVTADLATWGKGIANGFSCCALTGSRELMELGGLRNKGAKKVFLVSTTHGAESTGLAAMMKTISILKGSSILDDNRNVGNEFYEQVEKLIHDLDLNKYLEIQGDTKVVQTLKITGCQKYPQDLLSTFIFREMHNHGVLYNGLFYFMAAHRNEELDHLLKGCREALNNFSKILEKGEALPIYNDTVKPVFRSRV